MFIGTEVLQDHLKQKEHWEEISLCRTNLSSAKGKSRGSLVSPKCAQRLVCQGEPVWRQKDHLQKQARHVVHSTHKKLLHWAFRFCMVVVACDKLASLSISDCRSTPAEQSLPQLQVWLYTIAQTVPYREPLYKRQVTCKFYKTLPIIERAHIVIRPPEWSSLSAGRK